MMKTLLYYLLYAFAYVLSLLPLRVLYVLSDGIYPLLYYIIRYRRDIVRRNLTTSFPDMSETDIKSTERKFYQWLCDYCVETLKLLSISDKGLLKHVEYRNVDLVEKMFDEGRNCSAISGHYCNWEWFTGLQLVMKRHPQAVVGLIYHPLYNDAFDRLFIKLRSAHGGVCVPKKDILRRLVTYKNQNRRSIFGYVSDQAPKWENMHLWLQFLNHDTPVFTGGERIMRKMNDAVFFVDIQRPRRGHYTFTFQLITAEAANEEEFTITRQFFKMLETNIHRQPAFYLWTHNRWKRGREEFERKYDVIDGKIIRKEEYK